MIRKLLIFAFGIAAGSLGLHLWQNRPQSAPDTSTLKNSLQSVAQRAMEIPFLSDSDLQLVVERSRVDQEVERIKNLAGEFGGSAIQGTIEADGTDVLARVSSRSVDRFCSEVRDRDHRQSLATGRDAPVPNASPEMQLVVVRLKFAP